jgi:hypothetical protein
MSTNPTHDLNDEQVTIPLTLLEDLVQVCGYYRAQVGGFFAGETPENHPDLNAVCYLRDEATRIEAQARAFLGQQARGGQEQGRGIEQSL